MKNEKHFISYSRTDSSDFALKLATDLKANNFNIWLDQLDIHGGKIWDIEIQETLEKADCMIVILSKQSVVSSNVLDEVSYALKNKKRVIPVLKDDCKIPFRLDRIQYVDFRNGYNTGFKNLVTTLDENVQEIHISKPKTSRIKLWLSLSVIILVAVLLLFIINIKSGSNAANGNINTENTGSPTETSTASKNLFSTARYKARYEISEGDLVLYVFSLNSFPGINFDVNQNGIIDPNYDRSYGIISGSTADICTQYLLSNNSSTACGGAPSKATLSLVNNEFVFRIPLNEIKSSGNATTVSFQFSIYDNTWVLFPDRNVLDDFSKVYTIPVP